MRYLLAMLLLMGFSELHAQVRLLSLDELDKRVSKGKDTTYVINFWATWCSPCIAELPEFEKIGKTYASKPVKVLLVSVDFKSKIQKEVIPFVKKQGFKSEVFLLNESSQQEYISRVSENWSGAIPATLFIRNKKRYFFERSFTYLELEEQLRKAK